MSNEETPSRANSASNAIKTIAGFLAVLVGAAAVTTIAGIAIANGGDTAATVAGSTSGVVGSIVGAYLGVKIGTDQTQSAMDAQREESVKAQVYAAHIPKEDADKVVEKAVQAAESVRPERNRKGRT
jgi:hypothetical protein